MLVHTLRLLFLGLSFGTMAVPPPSAFNIRDYGATGLKPDDATPSVAKAIAGAKAVGGAWCSCRPAIIPA